MRVGAGGGRAAGAELVLVDLRCRRNPLGDAGSERRSDASDEGPVGLPDLRGLDDAKRVAPLVEAAGGEALVAGRWEDGSGGVEERASDRGGGVVGLLEGVVGDDQRRHGRVDAAVVKEDGADGAKHARAGREPAHGVERWRHRHEAAARHAAVGRAHPVDPAEGGGHADRAAGVGSQREIANTGRDRRGRAARRASRDATAGAHVDRRPVMRVLARQAVEELVTHRLADDGGAGVKQRRDRLRVLRGGPLLREPLRAAAARARPGDVEGVLDRGREPRERPGRGAGNGGDDVVRDEPAPGTRPRGAHAGGCGGRGDAWTCGQ